MNPALPIVVTARVQSDVHHYTDSALREEQAQPFVLRRTVHLAVMGLLMLIVGIFLLTTQWDEIPGEGVILACVLPVIGVVLPFSRKQLLQGEFKTKKMRAEPLTLEFTSSGFLSTTPTFQQQRDWSTVGETVEFSDGVLLQHGESATWVPSKGFATAAALQQFTQLAQGSTRNHRVLQPLEQYIGAGPDYVPVEVTESSQAMTQRFDEASQDAVVAILKTNVDFWVQGELRYRQQDWQHRSQRAGNWQKTGLGWAFGIIMIEVAFGMDWLLIAIPVVTLLVAAGAMLASAWNRAELRRKFASSGSGDMIFEFSPEGYRILGAARPWSARWASVHKVVEMRDGWILHTDGGKYRWIPMIALANREDAEELQQLLRASVAKYKVFRRLRFAK